MLRKTVGRLAVEDIVARAGAVLEPGTPLTFHRIERNGNPAPSSDVYEVLFESGGREYRCPLYRFQPRTRALEAVGSEEPRRGKR